MNVTDRSRTIDTAQVTVQLATSALVGAAVTRRHRKVGGLLGTGIGAAAVVVSTALTLGNVERPWLLKAVLLPATATGHVLRKLLPLQAAQRVFR